MKTHLLNLVAFAILSAYALWCASWLLKPLPPTPDTNAEGERLRMKSGRVRVLQ